MVYIFEEAKHFIKLVDFQTNQKSKRKLLNVKAQWRQKWYQRNIEENAIDGGGNYILKEGKWIDFLPSDEMEKWISEELGGDFY